MSKSNILCSLEPSYMEDDRSASSNTVTNRLQHFASPISKEPKIIVDSLKTHFEISPPTCSGSSTIDQLVSERNAMSNKGGETLREEQNERILNGQKSCLISFRELLEDKTTRREHRKDNILVWDDEETLATKRDENFYSKNDFEAICRKIEALIEHKYVQKLKEKDDEIKALKINLAFQTQKSQHEKMHPNIKNKIDEYEEIINQMRKAYEEKIVSSEKVYKKKILVFVTERKKMIEEIEDLKEKLRHFIEEPKKEKNISILTISDKKKLLTPTEGTKPKNILSHRGKPSKEIKSIIEKTSLNISKNSTQTQSHEFSFDKKCTREPVKEISHPSESKKDMLAKTKEHLQHISNQNVNFCGIKAPYNKLTKRHLNQSIAYFKGEKDNFLHQSSDIRRGESKEKH